MQLVGSTFCCEVPDGWSEAREPGCVLAASNEPALGFTPTAVLRESRVDDRRDALAAVSQANLRAICDAVPGTLVIRVEALDNNGVEHRRIYALSPVTPEELHGNILCVLSIQDLTVVEGVVAELTVTVPVIEWYPEHPCLAILDSLQAMPPSERAIPPTTAAVAEPVLDQWATTRDGAPREDLSVVTLPSLVLQAEPLTLTTHAVDVFLNSAATRVFPPVTGQVKEELAAADLVDEEGRLSEVGFWYADHLLSGFGWQVSVARTRLRDFRFWVTDATTMFVAPHPEHDGMSLMGYCPSNDLFRILLSWVEATPSWPIDVHLKLSGKQFQAKVEHDTPPPHEYHGDTAEFVRQPWTVLSLEDSSGNPHLMWVRTPARGSCTAWVEPSLLNIKRLLTIQQHHEVLHWLHLTWTVLKES